ncbi:hypothetical protein CIHG_02105 [Coccidioides immitis H538.4]|uniref:Uncharacterized protein n=3 Tax=Coccidioides immitis TaxID=5501 RepID=A0A0J8U4H0_COCIT|nr:hypothetical protein CIRG_00281 [Coccidioides immitis RMSCC 2394]KMU81772.1 hypothetical protein CISG_02790 [Coccidioides immitis RMSCC 3703]KMU84319.1 hypothetical protein CIHG_02105 [Coccidioides immitis H538.4]
MSACFYDRAIGQKFTPETLPFHHVKGPYERFIPPPSLHANSIEPLQPEPAFRKEEWDIEHLPMILQEYNYTEEACWWYISSLGQQAAFPIQLIMVLQQQMQLLKGSQFCGVICRSPLLSTDPFFFERRL